MAAAARGVHDRNQTCCPGFCDLGGIGGSVVCVVAWPLASPACRWAGGGQQWWQLAAMKMEASSEQQCKQAENDEEYVVLDLENVCMQADIPTNAPYTLSGLDTLNPTLTIGNHLKLIGEYQETIGTCIIFSERGGDVAKEQQQHTNGVNEEAPCKQFRHVATSHKVLRFRLHSHHDRTENVL